MIFLVLNLLWLTIYICFVLGSSSSKTLHIHSHGISCDKIRGLFVRCSSLRPGVRASRTSVRGDEMNLVSRRDLIGLVLGVSTLILDSFDAKGAGLPPEEKPRLCDDACEKELENVWWDYFTSISNISFLVADLISLNGFIVSCCDTLLNSLNLQNKNILVKLNMNVHSVKSLTSFTFWLLLGLLSLYSMLLELFLYCWLMSTVCSLLTCTAIVIEFSPLVS